MSPWLLFHARPIRASGGACPPDGDRHLLNRGSEVRLLPEAFWFSQGDHTDSEDSALNRDSTKEIAQRLRAPVFATVA
jgi:hypothetical protein